MLKLGTAVTLAAVTLATITSVPMSAQQAATPAAAAAPARPTGLAVGTMAPEFTMAGATRFGVLAQPVKLSDFRGQTVVLAFFPRARTRGCTVQMESYRDRYAELYNGGRKVVVLAVSTDADTTLAAWARELATPVLFASDADHKVGMMYQAGFAGRNVNARHLYVIDSTGRIVHRQVPFNELADVSYDQLGAAIRETLKEQ